MGHRILNTYILAAAVLSCWLLWSWLVRLRMRRFQTHDTPRHTYPHSTNIIYCICTSEKCISNKLSQYLVHVCMYVVVYWCLVWCLVWCIFCSEAQLMGSGGEEQPDCCCCDRAGHRPTCWYIPNTASGYTRCICTSGKMF